MTNLQNRQQKIQTKRKQTPWREFVKEIVSWVPLVFQQYAGKISRYPNMERTPTLLSPEEFMKQGIDANIQCGMDYDSSISFFDHFYKLFMRVSLPALSVFWSENSEYGDAIGNAKNSYLSYSLFETENVLYSYNVKSSKNVFNSLLVRDGSENIYYSSGVIKSYQIFYSKDIVSSHDIRFSYDLQGCQECLSCHNLSNQVYCIENKQYTKEEYFHHKALYLENRISYDQYWNSLERQKPLLVDTDEVENGHFCYRIHRGRNIIFGGSQHGYEDLFDVFNGGGTSSGQHMYGGVSNAGGDHNYMNILMGGGSHNYYTFYTIGCSHCFGCIGIQNQQFCIFNKQYEKEERHCKVNEIFGVMEKEGILGDFFPGRMNPFYFNDTAASLIEDFDKEEIVAEGYLWRDEEVKVDIPEWMDMVEVADLGSYEEIRHSELDSGSPGKIGDTGSNSGMTNTAWWIDPAILKKVIKDEQGNVYRVIKMEYDFLMKYGLPLPRKHWLERLKGHFRVK